MYQNFYLSKVYYKDLKVNKRSLVLGWETPYRNAEFLLFCREYTLASWELSACETVCGFVSSAVSHLLKF